MRRLLLLIAAACAASLAGPAPAQQAGSYAAQGRGMDGQEYRGTATLQPTGADTWRIGDDGAEGLGLLIPEGPLLVVGQSRSRSG